MDIEGATFVVIDTETTGLEPLTGDRICEVGAIKIKGGRELGRYESLVNPGRDISPEAQAKNKITPEMVKDAPAFAAIAPALRQFIAGTVLVGQNIEFDLAFLNAEFVAAGMSKLALPAVDTIPLARRARPGLASYNLDNLAFQFRVSFNARHRSIGDCEATVKIFLECAKILRQKGEARTLEDLIRRGSKESTRVTRQDAATGSPGLL
jgi:DNA polymerase III epsilon subunit family exonuclease